MKGKPFAASLILGALSLAGILAMFSQSHTALGDRESRRGSSALPAIWLDAGADGGARVDDEAQRVLERGIRHQIERSATKRARERAEPRPGVLRLR